MKLDVKKLLKFFKPRKYNLLTSFKFKNNPYNKATVAKKYLHFCGPRHLRKVKWSGNLYRFVKFCTANPDFCTGPYQNNSGGL